MSKPVDNQAIIRQLNWRYATKKFDPTRKIPAGDWATLEQAMILAPSSFGLQPWRFVIVNSPELRAALRPAAWGQPQITEASHLVVFAARKNLGAPDVDRLIGKMAQVRQAPVASLEGYRKLLLQAVSRPSEQVEAWAARQAYIALGSFLTIAALLGIDACPLEGFEPAKFDKTLGLDQQGYTAVVIATAGYRAPDDASAKLAKVRFTAEEGVLSVV